MFNKIIISLIFAIALGFFNISPVLAQDEDLLGVDYASYSGLESQDIRYSIGKIIRNHSIMVAFTFLTSV